MALEMLTYVRQGLYLCKLKNCRGKKCVRLCVYINTYNKMLMADKTEGRDLSSIAALGLFSDR